MELERRKFTYRGYTLEELRKMSMDAFIKLLPARQRRSLSRGIPLRHKKLMERLRRARRALKRGKELVVRTHNRDAVIFPEYVGLTIAVHNGKDFIPVKITPEHIGHYLGEYSITNKRIQHGDPGMGATRSSQYVPLK
ncbi:MAG: 30S ribosomal protein S19 [Promethearchaeota archaeon]